MLFPVQPTTELTTTTPRERLTGIRIATYMTSYRTSSPWSRGMCISSSPHAIGAEPFDEPFEVHLYMNEYICLFEIAFDHMHFQDISTCLSS